MKPNRYLRLVAMAAALAMVVAACAEEVAEIEDELGVITIAAGSSIQIRAHQVLSGPNAPLGIDQERGVRLAVEDFGAIKGFSVNLGTPEDDLCSSAGGQSGAQAIVAQADVVAVIGTTCSGAAASALPVYSAANMVMFSGSTTNPNLTSDLQGTAGGAYLPGMYRTAHNDLFQGAAVAKFVYDDLGLRTAAAIHDGDPYTEGLANAFRSAFETLGGTVPLFTATSAQPGVDQTALLTDVANADVEVVFFPIFPATGGPEIIQQKGDVAGLEDVVWVTADGLHTTAMLELTESVGVYFSGPDLNFGENTSATGKTYTQMREAYVSQFGEVPPAPFHAHTYDATVLVLTAIREVSVLGSDGSLRIGRKALRDYLTAVSNFDGLIGAITCDEFGDCGSQRVQIALHEDVTVTDVSLTPVKAAYARADVIDIITGGN